MITIEKYKDAKALVKDYETQELDYAKGIAKKIQVDIINYTNDKFWRVSPEILFNRGVVYYVTNEVTYDEDYSGEYDEFIEIELATKYEVLIHVTGIYGK